MFYKYILELKNRVFLICLSWVTTVFVCYNYKKTLLYLLIKLNSKMFNSDSFYFITTNLTDVFSVYVKLSCFLSNQFLCIYFFYHCLVFIAPGLYYTEYKNLITIFYLSICFNFTGIYLFNSYFLPYIWEFFLSYLNNSLDNSPNIFFEIQITEYLLFYIKFYYFLILFSQLFLFIFVCLILITDKVNTIKITRKIIYTIFLILSTLITPPDVISQLILTFFLVLVYEVIVKVVFFKEAVKVKFLYKNNYYC